MAITNIHPITATVHKAIEYICNADKTDDRLLVSSFGCAPETAHYDFAFTRQNAAIQSPNLAHHLIQAFKPGEVTPEEAHQIGQELADRMLGGKYSYVLTTHIDKGHVHNHLIFNAVDNEKYVHYNDCKQTYRRIRHISDELCQEHNLSVVEEQSGRRGKTWWQWNLSQDTDDPKVQLRRDINKCIKLTDSFEEFVEFMKMKGYQIKLGKYIAFGLPGTGRFIRGKEKTLGKKYAKEQIQERINHKPKISEQTSVTRLQFLLEVPVEALQNSQNIGLRRWATKENLKRAAETYNQMIENGIQGFEELNERVYVIKAQQRELRSSLRKMEWGQQRITEMKKYLKQYQGTKRVFNDYQEAYFRDRFFRNHEGEIIIHKVSMDYFKQQGIDPDKVDELILEEKHDRLSGKKIDLKNQLKRLEGETINFQMMRENIKEYLLIDNQCREKERNYNTR